MAVLALDTSNYTTSVAVFDGQTGCNRSKLLEVRPGELGLRQSDALFQHVRELPGLFEQLERQGLLDGIAAVGASTRPREAEGSYMPCFLAGSSQGRGLAHTLGVPFFAHSHQQGHLAAAAWSAGRLDLLDGPFLAWHLSGGTTELLRVEPQGCSVKGEIIGGTTDISAGQLIDRTGVLLGLPFPAGKALDALAGQSAEKRRVKVKLDGLEFSFSGLENQMQKLRTEGAPPEETAAFVLRSVSDAVVRATEEALRQHPGLPVVFSGGVASNTLLRARCAKLDPVFAPPQYSTDNALGVAVLAWRLGVERWNR